MNRSEAEPAAKRVRLDYRDTITVLVGPAKTSFTVHKTSICTRSPFFEKATSAGSSWVEAKEGTVTLSETEPEVFEAYLHWVYTEKFELDSIVVPWKVALLPSYVSSAKLWVFADMMLDHDLCNHITDLVIDKHNRNQVVGHSRFVSMIWKLTPPGSKFRTLLVDLFTAKNNSAASFREKGDQFPRDFVLELAQRHLTDESRCKISKTMSQHDTCERYHLHPDGAVCEG